MNAEFQQYRFARIEGHNITRARLDAQFKNGINNLNELEEAIAEQLTAEGTNCAPWRKLEVDQTGYLADTLRLVERYKECSISESMRTSLSSG